MISLFVNLSGVIKSVYAFVLELEQETTLSKWEKMESP